MSAATFIAVIAPAAIAVGAIIMLVRCSNKNGSLNEIIRLQNEEISSLKLSLQDLSKSNASIGDINTKPDNIQL